MTAVQSTVLYGTLGIVLGIAVLTDVWRHRIPNVLTFSAVALGLLLHTWLFGAEGLGDSAAGLLVGLLALLPLYLLGGMGAGDVKLMAAVGALLGFKPAVASVVCTLIVGGVIGLALLIVRGGLGSLLRRYRSTLRVLWTTGTLNPTGPAPGEVAAQRFPYALAIGLGTLAAFLWVRM